MSNDENSQNYGSNPCRTASHSFFIFVRKAALTWVSSTIHSPETPSQIMGIGIFNSLCAAVLIVLSCFYAIADLVRSVSATDPSIELSLGGA
jgi:hypothetical protein